MDPSHSKEFLQLTVPCLLRDYAGVCLVVAHQRRGNLCGISSAGLVVVGSVDRDGLPERATLGDDPVLVVRVVAGDVNPGTLSS